MEEGRHTSLMDYTTLLPPRKRLLCGLKKQGCGRGRSPPPRSDDSNDLRTRVDELLDLSDVSLEKVIETSKLTASAAANAAASARTVALEKAAAAVRAKVFARSVLELVGSFRGNEVCGESCLARKRGQKKCVAVEHLYNKSDSSSGGSRDDEELARRLHQAMNSSPRISRKRKSRHDGLTGTGDPFAAVACGVNLTPLCNGDGTVPSNGDSIISKTEVKHLVRSTSEKVVKNGERSTQTSQKNGSGVRTRIMLDKNGRTKRKKLLLSQCCGRDSKDFGAVQESNGHTFYTDQKKIMFRERKLPSNGGMLPVEVDSTRKCKKLKVPLRKEPKSQHLKLKTV